jgi:hypothetical protein
MDNLSLIFEQPFIKVEREIDGIEQKYIEKKYFLYLYETKLVTPFQIFELKDIADVSFRKTKANIYGTLYLHVGQSVFPYYIYNDPEPFINAVKQLFENKKRA